MGPILLGQVPCSLLSTVCLHEFQAGWVIVWTALFYFLTQSQPSRACLGLRHWMCCVEGLVMKLTWHARM